MSLPHAPVVLSSTVIISSHFLLPTSSPQISLFLDCEQKEKEKEWSRRESDVTLIHALSAEGMLCFQASLAPKLRQGSPVKLCGQLDHLTSTLKTFKQSNRVHNSGSVDMLTCSHSEDDNTNTKSLVMAALLVGKSQHFLTVASAESPASVHHVLH